MTQQEKTFANEYVFLHFNGGDAAASVNAAAAAKKAGYEIPADRTAADTFCKGLLAKCSDYIAEQTAAFAEKLSGAQRRNLWAAIAAMEAGDPDDALPALLPLKTI